MSKWYDGSLVVLYCSLFLMLLIKLTIPLDQIPFDVVYYIKIFTYFINVVYLIPMILALCFILFVRIACTDKVLFGHPNLVKDIIFSGRILETFKASFQDEFYIKLSTAVMLFFNGYIKSFYLWCLLLLLTEWVKHLILSFYYKYHFDKIFEEKDWRND